MSLPVDAVRSILDGNVVVRLYPEAAMVLNLGRSSAYQAAAAGEIKTLRFGRSLKVPTSWLREQLGIDPPRAA